MKRGKEREFHWVAKKAARILDAYVGEGEDYLFPRECLTEEEVIQLCSKKELPEVIENDKRTAFNRAQKRMDMLGIQRVICAVCDRGFSKLEAISRRLQDSTARKWAEVLKGSDDVPSDLRKYYDISQVIPSLSGALLSEAGLEKNLRFANTYCTGKLWVCKQCDRSLKNYRLPKFSIANGFDIGRLPAGLSEAKSIERRLTSLTSVAHTVSVLSGGKHRCIKGHVFVMRMNPTLIAKRLPELLSENDTSFLVILAGEMTSAQDVLAMRRHRVRVGYIRRLLRFYLENNVLYDVVIDENVLRQLEQRDGDAGLVVERVDRLSDIEQEQDVALSVGSVNGTEENVESEYHETTSIHVESCPQKMTEAMSVAEKTLLIRHRGELVSDFDRSMMALAFPELFPYGRGHPGTNRDIPVSLEECCRYYLSLSTRAFSEHPSFLLVAFDVCGRQRVINSTSIRSRWKPSEFGGHANVSQAELIHALRVQRHRREQVLLDRPGPNLYSVTEGKQDSQASLLLRSVRVSQAKMWGSAEEKMVYRRRAFAMDAFYKTGAIFLTITPSDVGSIIVATIAGRVGNNVLNQLEAGELPDRAERTSIAGLDHFACSEYFEIVFRYSSKTLSGLTLKKDYRIEQEDYLDMSELFWVSLKLKSREICTYMLSCLLQDFQELLRSFLRVATILLMVKTLGKVFAR